MSFYSSCSSCSFCSPVHAHLRFSEQTEGYDGFDRRLSHRAPGQMLSGLGEVILSFSSCSLLEKPTADLFMGLRA